MMAPNAQMLDSQPWMRARSAAVNRSPMMVCAIGTRPPAPMPCKARKAISEGMFQAKPHSTEPMRKSPIAVSSTRLRPNRSASRP